VVYISDDGPKIGPNLVTCVINCVVHDVTPLDAFIQIKHFAVF